MLFPCILFDAHFGRYWAYDFWYDHMQWKAFPSPELNNMFKISRRGRLHRKCTRAFRSGDSLQINIYKCLQACVYINSLWYRFYDWYQSTDVNLDFMLHLVQLWILFLWRSQHIHHKVWSDIINPFPNFNGPAIEIWECIRHFIPWLIEIMITYPYFD